MKRGKITAIRDEGRATIGFRRRSEKRESAAAFLEGNPLLIALDLGSERHAAWVAGKDLVPVQRFTIEHSYAGIVRLVECMRALAAERDYGRVVIFMEPTSYFWQNVAHALDEQGVDYRTVAPLAVDRQREIEHLTYAKGDYRDAELILRLGAGGQWLHRALDKDPLWIALHALSLEHELVLELETAERLRIGALLGLVLPEFSAEFKDHLGVTARAVLRCLTRSPAPRGHLDLRERLAAVPGYRLRRRKIEALAEQLVSARSFGVEQAIAPALVRIGLALGRFEAACCQRQALREQLVQLYEQTPYREILDSVPGITAESHALLLGFIGDPKRYDRATCLSKLAGTEPRENESGKAEGSHSISRRGRRGLRSVLYRVVLGFQRGNPELAAYMQRLRKRENNPLAWHQAAVATANKYLRLVHRLCTTGQRYDASRLGPRPVPLGASPQ